MTMQQYKPTTPGRRGMSSADTSMLTTKDSVTKLKTIKKRSSGRNNAGRITVRHRGGGAKRFYRHVSFRLPEDFSGVVEQIEYDPNRTARIARVKDDNGQYHYVLASNKMKVGTKIECQSEAEISEGNRLKIANIPEGAAINTIEFTPGSGGKMVRSAGASAQLLSLIHI